MDLLAAYPDRQFRLWAYVPTHSKLLLRSGDETPDGIRIDIAFLSVRWIELPLIMQGLLISRLPSRTEGVASGAPPELNKAEQWFLVKGDNYRGSLVAQSFEIDERRGARFRDIDKWGICEW
ncbi:hypothetical protein [Herbidospora sp. NBRC 101105]|uniref:hypothetical protein n=1 Tax=Herbidospora sp. NBRC 101105 TaxID=3032195 RepID=UPI0024A2A11E|nr:hypothetical protein [Herbidospora sp. NBRC 101105]GLX96738.1 hypothetical protein Hesp01_46880 [Herbidospora sp. NBRC 101105]